MFHPFLFTWYYCNNSCKSCIACSELPVTSALCRTTWRGLVIPIINKSCRKSALLYFLSTRASKHHSRTWIYDYIDNLKLKIILPYFTHKDWLCWCSMLHFQRCSLPRRTQGVRLALEELRSARRSTHRGDGEKNFAMISHHFSPSFVTQNWLRHTSPCHRNWGYLHFPIETTPTTPHWKRGWWSIWSWTFVESSNLGT